MFESKQDSGIFDNSSNINEIAPPPLNNEICFSGDVKLSRQASVLTTAGRSLTKKETFAPLPKWINISSSAHTIISLQYHSSDAIRLIKLEQKEKKGKFKRKISALSCSGDSSENANDAQDDVIPLVVHKTYTFVDMTDETNLPLVSCITIKKS